MAEYAQRNFSQPFGKIESSAAGEMAVICAAAPLRFSSKGEMAQLGRRRSMSANTLVRVPSRSFFCIFVGVFRPHNSLFVGVLGSENSARWRAQLLKDHQKSGK